MKKILMAGGMLSLGPAAFASSTLRQKMTGEVSCTLYRAVNDSPAVNLIKVIELMGGIEKVIGSEDVVVIKPNLQWWNQGASNLSAFNAFVGLIMNRPGGFYGEVVLPENCHCGSTPWKVPNSGWAYGFERNSELKDARNMNDLSRDLKKKYGNRFSTCHWIDVDSGGKRVAGPEEGDGYVYCDGTRGVPLIKCDNGLNGKDYRATIMTYPIFKTDRGTVIDFKRGIWEKGSYTGQPLRFVNFAALNHHSAYCGATSALKNYLGISDLSGGPAPHNGGRLTGDYFNFHSFPYDEWAPGPQPGMLGAEIGVFMNTIRKADLNITTAEWIGLASRTEPPVAHTRAILACDDPVALDYHAAKYLLYPNSALPIHNPDNANSPLRAYLMKCSEEGGGIFNERHVKVVSYDFAKSALQDDGDLVVMGEKQWGSHPKTIMKYLLLKYWTR